MTNYEYNKRYRERLKLRGLCIKCRRKRNAGRWMCDTCMRKQNEQRRLLNPVYCRECKKPIKSEERIRGRIFHKKCAENRLARIYPQQHRSAALAYQRRHRAKGLCKSCPRKVFKGGLCRRHYGMGRKRELERRVS